MMPGDDVDHERGAPPAGGRDPEVAEAGQLPDLDPAWRPSDLAQRLRRRFGGQLDDRPPDRLWFPHLLIRGAAGDTGERPLWEPTPCWTSPDIHLLPAGAPLDLTLAVQSPTVGESYTVAVHVWNLGRFPAYGVAVRAYWVQPGFFAGTPDPKYAPHFIGGVFTDLGDRDSGQAHRIVGLPQPWPVPELTERHACLLAVVESFADPWTGALAANADRHVAQRNLTILSGSEDVGGLLDELGAMIDVGGFLGIDLGAVRTPSLAAAVERGVARHDDVSAGLGPVGLGPLRPVARLARGEQEWFRQIRGGGRDRPEGTGQDRLGPVVAELLGAAGTTATDLVNGSRLGGAGRSALHLTTRDTGYTIIVAG